MIAVSNVHRVRPRPMAAARILIVMLCCSVLGMVACSRSTEYPGWLAGLPTVERSLTPGDQLWLAAPVDDVTAVRWDWVTAVADGETTVLVDGLGRTLPAVPMALTAPPSDGVEAGEAVMALHPAAGLVFGRVASADGGAVVVAMDWNGSLVEAPVSAVRRLSDELAPFQPIAYRGDTVGWTRGVLIALDRRHAWIADATGRVVRRPVSEVHPARGLGTERELGEAVLAYTWADGFEPGVVEAPSPRGYEVRLASGELAELSMSALIDAPADWFE